MESFVQQLTVCSSRETEAGSERPSGDVRGRVLDDEPGWSAIYRFWDALKRSRGAGLFNTPVLWQGKREEERSLAKRASGLLVPGGK
jgi:hypothetical protein